VIDSVSLDDAGPIARDLVAAIVRDAARLSELDGAIGDGDHGINMSKGFRLADARLGDAVPDLAQGLQILGDTLLNEVGGAMGPIYGTFFGEMGQHLGDAGRIDRASFALALSAATGAVHQLGGAAPGDKTLIDVLVPALAAYDNAAGRDDAFAACLDAMDMAACDGLATTRDMIAKVGRAARLGERSRGTLDPGAASCRLLLATLADGLRKRLQR
jgi:phosphoenolpyruvate---glycerone phosphotransferase subunit DhaL